MVDLTRVKICLLLCVWLANNNFPVIAWKVMNKIGNIFLALIQLLKHAWEFGRPSYLADKNVKNTLQLPINQRWIIITHGHLKFFTCRQLVGRLPRPDIVHFRSACRGTEICLRELTLLNTLSSNPKSSRSVDLAFSYKLLFYLH